MNNAFDVITSRMDTAEENISHLEDMLIEIPKMKCQDGKEKKNVEQYSGTMGKLWKM